MNPRVAKIESSRPLWTLGSDLLNFITLFVPGGAILNLWSSGDTRLRKLLANGGVTEIRFEDCGINSTSRFPRALRHLQQLRVLSIRKPNERIGFYDRIRSDLQRLSPHLEELHLDFPEAEESLHAEQDACNLFEEEETSSTDVYATIGVMDDTGGAGQFWNLASYFPRLHTLSLRLRRKTLSENYIKSLPKTLTSLRLSRVLIGIPEISTMHTLQSLVLSGRLISSEIVSMMPPNLTSLESTVMTPPEEFLRALPKTITNIAPTPSITPGLLHLVPPLLSTILLERYGTSIEKHIQALPRHLVSLSITNPAEPNSFTPQVISLLPITLKSLFLGGPLNGTLILSGITSEQWPPHLTKFCSDWALEISPNFFSTFPTSLVHLSLELYTITDSNSSTTSPSSSTGKSPTRPQMRSLLEGFGERRLRLLTYFRVHQWPQNVPTDSLKWMPRSLTSLNLTGALALSSERFWNLLPPSLTDVFFEASENFVVETEQGLQPATATISGIEKLRHLSSLTIKILTRTTFSCSWFAKLPPGLIRLVVTANVNYDTRDVAALPKTLETLELTGNRITDQISADAIATLPRTLRTFIVQRADKWPSSVLGDLPRGLRSFFCTSLGKLEERDLALLPPSLSNLSIEFGGVNPSAVQYLPPSVQSADGIISFWDRDKFATRHLGSPFVCPDPRVTARFKRV